MLAERKLRVADVARATKLSKTTLHKLYNEESKRIDFETIDKLCSFLNCQVSDLFEYREDEDLEDHDSVATWSNGTRLVSIIDSLHVQSFLT